MSLGSMFKGVFLSYHSFPLFGRTSRWLSHYINVECCTELSMELATKSPLGIYCRRVGHCVPFLCVYLCLISPYIGQKGHKTIFNQSMEIIFRTMIQKYKFHVRRCQATEVMSLNLKKAVLTKLCTCFCVWPVTQQYCLQLSNRSMGGSQDTLLYPVIFSNKRDIAVNVLLNKIVWFTLANCNIWKTNKHLLFQSEKVHQRRHIIKHLHSFTFFWCLTDKYLGNLELHTVVDWDKVNKYIFLKLWLFLINIFSTVIAFIDFINVWTSKSCCSR